MKKLLFSIGSFALSLSAPNAAQLELPENAADVASSVSVPNNNPCVTKDVTNLSQDADASEDNVRTDSSQFVRQSSAEAARIIAKGDWVARVTRTSEELYIILLIPPDIELGGSLVADQNRAVGTRQVILKFTREILNNRPAAEKAEGQPAEAAHILAKGDWVARDTRISEELHTILLIPPDIELGGSLVADQNRAVGTRQETLKFTRDFLNNRPAAEKTEGQPAEAAHILATVSTTAQYKQTVELLYVTLCMPLDMELRESVTRDNIPENRIAFEFAIKRNMLKIIPRPVAEMKRSLVSSRGIILYSDYEY